MITNDTSMRNKLVVLIKFNRNDLHRQPDNGQRFKRTLARLEWWEKRYAILRDIVLPSLARQTFTKFDIIAPFTTDINYDHAKKTIDLLQQYGAHVFWDDRKLKDFVEPDAFIRKKYSLYDNVILLNLDSDDIYHPHAFEYLMRAPVNAGQVYIFRDGYLFELPDGRLGEYHGHVVPPPFFAFTFTRQAMKSEKHWKEYRDQYNLWVEHPTLTKAKVVHLMAPGLFCQLIHGTNVTSTWLKHEKKIVRIITGDERKRVLSGLMLR